MTNDPSLPDPETGASVNPSADPATTTRATPEGPETDALVTDAWLKRYDDERARLRAAQTEALKVTKPLLFAALTAAGITRVTVVFDGSGDSGQIECIRAIDKDDAPVELPAVMITSPSATMVPTYEPCTETASRLRFVGNTIQTGEETESVAALIERIFWDFIESRHDGWENNDGGHGECVFDPGENIIRLEMNERYTETNYYEHEI